MQPNGWTGPTTQMNYTLDVVGADRDEDGRFLVSGQIVSFLGMGDELVIGGDARYYVNGKPCSLAGLLQATSYGVPVEVIR